MELCIISNNFWISFWHFNFVSLCSKSCFPKRIHESGIWLKFYTSSPPLSSNVEGSHIGCIFCLASVMLKVFVPLEHYVRVAGVPLSQFLCPPSLPCRNYPEVWSGIYSGYAAHACLVLGSIACKAKCSVFLRGLCVTQNSYVEILTLNVMVLGWGGLWKVIRS